MNKIKSFLCILLCLSLLFSFPLCVRAKQKSTPPKIQADAAVLLDMETGEVLFALNEKKELYIASLTKIMVLTLIMEDLENGAIHLSDMVVISNNALREVDGSNIHLRQGERLRVEELLKAVFLESACDACLALCEYTAGSLSEFVNRMNRKAMQLGLQHTRFENCTGVDVSTTDHYSCAEDVACMSRELMRHAAVSKYSSLKADRIKNGTLQLVNTNKLLGSYDGCIGLKTGTTSKAGFCLSAVAMREGATLCAVILGADTAQERLNQTKTLLDYGLSGKETHRFRTHVTRQASCTEAGEARLQCEKCGKSLAKILPATGHDWGEWETICAPTCTQEGMQRRVCTNNVAHVQTETLSMTEHQWGEWTVLTPPTCTQDGEQCRVCAHNPAHVQTEILPMTGHQWGAWMVLTPPSCTSEGIEACYCTKDKAHVQTRQCARREHTPSLPVLENTVAADCTRPGSLEHVCYCVDCGLELSRRKTKTPATGHAFAAVIAAPTATASGFTQMCCRRCGEKEAPFAFTAPCGVLKKLKCKRRGDTSQTLVWQEIQGAQGYQIQISTKDGKRWDKIQYAGKSNTYTFRRLAPGGNYKFRVRLYARRADGKYIYGKWSEKIHSPSLPSAVRLLKTVGEKRGFRVWWKANKAVTGYQLRYSTNQQMKNAKTITLKGAKSTQRAVKKLKAKQRYFVQLRAYQTAEKKTVFSVWSTPITIKTK